MGGKLHLKLNIGTRPIANKYREGKMKSTLKREWKVRETVEKEPIGAFICNFTNQLSYSESALNTITGQHQLVLDEKQSGSVRLRVTCLL